MHPLSAFLPPHSHTAPAPAEVLDATTAAAPQSGFWSTCRLFFSHPVLLRTALACAATQFVTYAVLNFTTLFLMREKGMSLEQVALWYALFRTTWGLHTRAVGEHPSAAETVGISVVRMRYLNLILGGAIAGLAGAYLSLEAVGSFERGMTNGKGFVALAVMIFGRWNPVGAWGAALLFGYTNAIQTQFQFRGWFTDHPQFVGMLPFIVTIIVLAGFVGRARPPASLGQPYDRE